MKRIVSGVVVVGLAVLVMAGAPGLAAQAPPAPPQAMAIGIVDLTRFTQEYKGLVQLNAQFQDFQDQQAAAFNERVKTRVLSDAEQREYLDLSTMGAPTDANKSRMTELVGLSDKREQRLNELARKQARTPDEQKDYDELNRIYSTRMGELRQLQTDQQQAAAAKQNELMKVIDESVNSAIRTVAEQKKLSIVLAKEVVRFGGVDITDEVLVKLNAAPLPKPATTTPPLSTLAPAAGAPAAPAKPAAGAPTAPPASGTPAPATTTPPPATPTK